MKEKIRLHKLLAQAGMGGRRTVEEWIKEGRIRINGMLAQIGQLASWEDEIYVEGKRIRLPRETSRVRVLVYHKAEGELCASFSPEGKKTVFEALPPIRDGKWIAVGRLDLNTAGLLLFTNHGELAHRLMHPRFNIPRHYAVRVLGKVTPEMLTRLKQGVRFEEGLFRFNEIKAHRTSPGANQWFTVTLKEGKYREVRRLWESQGCIVSRLIRIKHGIIELPRYLKKSAFEELSPDRVEALLESVSFSLPA